MSHSDIEKNQLLIHHYPCAVQNIIKRKGGKDI